MGWRYTFGPYFRIFKIWSFITGQCKRPYICTCVQYISVITHVMNQFWCISALFFFKIIQIIERSKKSIDIWSICAYGIFILNRKCSLLFYRFIFLRLGPNQRVLCTLCTRSSSKLEIFWLLFVLFYQILPRKKL